ncbi:MAG: type I-C CRISPR-associated protein Cas5c [Geminicoccaceae bacterium]|nr:type I-C CRISPR-associated protein Cas5c [Geminicoccaceae bacterium]MDW8126025.1 type I-C CRISPR-associated protein Cas5c [Geminicoccaceae bacterium]
MQVSRPFRLLVWGDYALFTRPEMKVERVSYEIMTPSAARGILEAILWKPQMRWIVERIDRLKPVRFHAIRRNEVALKASPDRPEIRADDPDVRQQRAALVLRDVAYLVHARIGLTERAGPEDSLTKYVVMFKRRAEAGQCHKQPCLGCREFSAFFRLLAEDEPDPPADTSGNSRPGWIFYDWDFAKTPPQPRFFEAVIEEGRMRVPPFESLEVRG